MNNNYQFFLIEACKITGYCLLIVAVLWVCGANNQTILIAFNMTVMSCAATLSAEKNNLRDVLIGCTVVVVSVLAGGFIGNYFPDIALWSVLVYAILAFLIPKTVYFRSVFSMGALVYLIFSWMHFSWSSGWIYTLTGLFVIIMLALFFIFFNRNDFLEKDDRMPVMDRSRYLAALAVGFSLVIALFVVWLLKRYTHLNHLYWVGLTALTVIQGSLIKNIFKVALLRVLVNVIGALLIVLLLVYVIPPDFLVNFILLVIFLFCIFALSFSYVLRVLFIELFVLGFTHYYGHYQNTLPYDRALLTLIGGAIVMVSALLSRYVLTKLRPKTMTQ